MPKLQPIGFKSPMPQSGKKNGDKRAILGLWVKLQAEKWLDVR